MKRFLKFTAAAITLALALLACSNDEDKITGSFLVEADESIAIDKTGGEQSIKVTSTVDYVATSDATWCSITEKTETGFKFRVDANPQINERTAEITVSAVGFTTVRIRVVQAGADANFSIAFEERNKTFTPEGGELTVSVTGNVAYTVTSSQAWCTYKGVTTSGFTLVAAAYGGLTPRTALVLVAPANGLQAVRIEITQNANVILQNGWFVDDMNHWETSGTADLFKRTTDEYLPGGAPTGAHYVTHNFNLSVEGGVEGYITQKITGVPDGNYTLSCDVAGYPGNSPDTDGIYLIAIDKDDHKTQKKLPFPEGSWMSAKYPERKGERELSVTVTGGECTVGLYVKAAGGANSTMTFKVLNFKFE
jgi:hypothetical protein